MILLIHRCKKFKLFWSDGHKKTRDITLPKIAKSFLKFSTVIFMETNWLQIFPGSFKDYWPGGPREFADFSTCIFPYSRGCYSGPYQLWKIGRLAKIGNGFCKTLNLRYLTGFWMRLSSPSVYENFNARILACFKDWVFLTLFKPPFHSYWKQIS